MDILELDPYIDDFYKYIIENFGDSTGELHRMADYFGINIGNFCEELIENKLPEDIPDEETAKKVKEDILAEMERFGVKDCAALREIDKTLTDYDTKARTFHGHLYDTREEKILAEKQYGELEKLMEEAKGYSKEEVKALPDKINGMGYLPEVIKPFIDKKIPNLLYQIDLNTAKAICSGNETADKTALKEMKKQLDKADISDKAKEYYQRILDGRIFKYDLDRISDMCGNAINMDKQSLLAVKTELENVDPLIADEYSPLIELGIYEDECRTALTICSNLDFADEQGILQIDAALAGADIRDEIKQQIKFDVDVRLQEAMAITDGLFMCSYLQTANLTTPQGVNDAAAYIDSIGRTCDKMRFIEAIQLFNGTNIEKCHKYLIGRSKRNQGKLFSGLTGITSKSLWMKMTVNEAAINYVLIPEGAEGIFLEPFQTSIKEDFYKSNKRTRMTYELFNKNLPQFVSKLGTTYKIGKNGELVVSQSNDAVNAIDEACAAASDYECDTTDDEDEDTEED